MCDRDGASDARVLHGGVSSVKFEVVTDEKQARDFSEARMKRGEGTARGCH